MITDWDNKVAVITGGAGGIGLELARCCLQRGMRVAIADNRDEALATARAALDAGPRLLTINCDVSTLAGNATLAGEVAEHFGAIHLVCLNAGIGRLRPLSETSEREWRLQVGVNLDGPFFGVQAFLPYLEREPQSHIVITASVMSLFSAGMMVPYYATKAGVLSLAEGLYLELQAAGSAVGVSALMPGDTRTGAIVNNLTEDTDPEIANAARAELENATPPSVVAEAVMDAVAAGAFYILPNPGNYWDIIDARMGRIRSGEHPRADYDTV